MLIFVAKILVVFTKQKCSLFGLMLVALGQIRRPDQINEL